MTESRMLTATVRAGGAVLWRSTAEHDGHAGAVEIALVHRPRYDDWSLPKGKLDAGETVHAATVREIAEETGFSAVLGRNLGQARYPVPDGNSGTTTKRVDYFAARAGYGTFTPNEEVDELRWLPMHRAVEQVSYEQDRTILTEFAALPPNTATVLLVRHAEAGRRSEWSGDDDLRPLTPAGRAQAAALRTLLPAFGPTAVHAAPRLRCEETVDGLAVDLGVPILQEPLLSEQGYSADVDAATARLLEIAAGPGVPVVSSQGGVIPDLIARLAIRSGLTLQELAGAKGSVWVLSLSPTGNGAPPRLVAADYLADPFPPQAGDSLQRG